MAQNSTLSNKPDNKFSIDFILSVTTLLILVGITAMVLTAAIAPELLVS